MIVKYCTCGRCENCHTRGITDCDLDQFLARNPEAIASRGPSSNVTNLDYTVTTKDGKKFYFDGNGKVKN